MQRSSRSGVKPGVIAAGALMAVMAIGGYSMASTGSQKLADAKTRQVAQEILVGCGVQGGQAVLNVFNKDDIAVYQKYSSDPRVCEAVSRLTDTLDTVGPLHKAAVKQAAQTFHQDMQSLSM